MSAPETDSEADRRWAAAAQLAAGVNDDRLRGRRVRVLLWVGLLVIASWVAGFVLALVLPAAASTPSTGEANVSARLFAALIVMAIGLVVGLVGFIWGIRTGHYIARWRAVTSPLSMKEKRAVRKQINGKAPVDQQHLDIILASAEQTRRAVLGIAPLYAAVVLFVVSEAIVTDAVLERLLALFASVMFAIAAVQLVVAYRRAGRFIEQNDHTVARG
ncbi:hypothetical protein [Gryllotalpicola ginsengisoli]|uniref:hypothetical protein n=1 Tax=Gryllotalpicola ginsengisoli TaxID=444608 RepID=UPI0012DBE950|nr:hypothetical protein [Gryllotalpicola ginsengisoli]